MDYEQIEYSYEHVRIVNLYLYTINGSLLYSYFPTKIQMYNIILTRLTRLFPQTPKIWGCAEISLPIFNNNIEILELPLPFYVSLISSYHDRMIVHIAKSLPFLTKRYILINVANNLEPELSVHI